MERKHILGPVDGPPIDWIPEEARRRIAAVVESLRSSRIPAALSGLRRAFVEMPKAAPGAVAEELDRAPAPVCFRLAALVLSVERDFPNMVAERHARQAVDVLANGVKSSSVVEAALAMAAHSVCPFELVDSLCDMANDGSDRGSAAATVLARLVARDPDVEHARRVPVADVLVALRRGVRSSNIGVAAQAAIASRVLGLRATGLADLCWSLLERAQDDLERYGVLTALEVTGRDDPTTIIKLAAYIHDDKNAKWLRGIAARSFTRIASEAEIQATIDQEIIGEFEIIYPMLESAAGDGAVAEELRDLLRAWLCDADSDMRCTAMIVIADSVGLADKLAEELLARCSQERSLRNIEALTSALLQARQIPVDRLVDGFRMDDVVETVLCGRLLVHRGPDGLRAMVSAIRGETSTLRRGALVAFVRDYGNGISGVAASLGALLDEEQHEETAMFIAHAIAAMGAGAYECLPSLLRAVGSRWPYVAALAESTIRGMGPAAEGGIRDALKTAEGVAARRLTRALHWVAPVERSLMRLFSQANTKLLLRAHCVGSIVRRTEVAAWRDLQSHLKDHGDLKDMIGAVSWSTLRRALTNLNSLVGGRHPTVRIDGDGFRITSRGWRVMSALESYLRSIGAIA